MKSTFVVLILSGFLSLSLQAQNSANIALSGKVFLAGEKGDAIKVLVYQDNDQITSITTQKNSFNLTLPFNEYYTLKVVKEGYAPYTAYIDARTSTPLSRNRKLQLNIDLASNDVPDDEYYADFPDAIFRFDSRMGDFKHSEHYSAHIMEMKAPLQAELKE